MSKNLVIIRHAEALNRTALQTDFDRNLSEKGINDAQDMARFLLTQNISPELIIASSAQRTTETALIFSKILNLAENNITLDYSLYNGSFDELKAAICFSDIPDEVNCVFLIAHNPGISIFAMECTHDITLSSMPPGGLIALKLDANSWIDFSPNKTTAQFYKFPPRK